ncbi:fimbrial protein [Pseudomonas tohonis]|uniref:fimbrial protein n=1 Tax=Pseudomonas tohonis TaxID=2725477 RepID=UPI0021D81BBA|nr:fimbrial protein [Pseudomonas tohonis]UXY50463.1 type 1 fimbrial protein [Pseudomonas tohonis]
MKKFLTASAALVGFGLSSLALAVDGTITIKGEVSSKTCSIDSTSLNQTIQLPVVSQSSLASGQNAGFKPFGITLSSCTQGSKVKANFEIGPNVNPADGTLKNELNGADASNVAVQLFNKNQQPIDLVSGTNNLEEISGAGGKATLDFFAAYLAPTGVSVTPGQVSTSVTYTMSYE